MWNLEKGTDEPICKAEIETQMNRTNVWTPGGKRLLLLLSHFSRVRLCATPQMAAHQAPLSLGFSRQEHGSALRQQSPTTQYVDQYSLQSVRNRAAQEEVSGGQQNFTCCSPSLPIAGITT